MRRCPSGSSWSAPRRSRTRDAVVVRAWPHGHGASAHEMARHERNRSPATLVRRAGWSADTLPPTPRGRGRGMSDVQATNLYDQDTEVELASAILDRLPN